MNPHSKTLAVLPESSPRSASYLSFPNLWVVSLAFLA
jgi:hypothetical protein